MHAKMFMVMLALSWLAPAGCGGDDGDPEIVDRDYATGGATSGGEDEGTTGHAGDDRGGEDEGSSGEGDPEPDVCEAYAAWSVGCEPEADLGEIVTTCTQERSGLAPACLGLFDAGVVCLAEAACLRSRFTGRVILGPPYSGQSSS